jgi:hypothetical protein
MATIKARKRPMAIAKLVRWYIDSFQSISKWRRSKQTYLKFLERHPIAEADARKLTTPKLVVHIQSRRADGAGPQRQQMI